MKKPLVLFLIIFAQHVLIAGKFLRYNLQGYQPADSKTAILMADEDCSSLNWTLKNLSGSTLLSGSLGNSLTGKGDYMPKNYNYRIDFSSLQDTGTYSLNVEKVGTYKIRINCNPYQAFIPDILRAVRVRRSGSPHALDHAISHRGDSACPVFHRNGGDIRNWSLQGNIGKINMSGGFYDAGDYIKFTLTNAYLTYFLLRSYLSNPDYYC